MSVAPAIVVPTSTADILATALSLRAAGVSILPADHRTKRPHWDLLPTDTTGKAIWKPFQQQVADEATVRRWFAPGRAQSVAVVAGAISGGILVFDFDVDGFYPAWLELVGELADGLPVQRTGGGGYQAFCRCPAPGGNTDLAWAACDAEESGRTIAIETRGEGGYALVPPSLHPDGGRYTMVSGDLTQIPLISQARADALLAAARKLDECPYTRQQRERLEREAHEAHQRRAAANRNGSASVIDQFNAANPLDALLERHGYTRCGERFVRPGGRSASVSIKDGRSCHFSSNDPLNDGTLKAGIGVHDAFDVFAQLEHGGDVTAAVRAAADLLGLSSEQRRQNPLKSTPCADETPAGGNAAGVSSMSALKGKASQSLRVEPYRPFPTDVLPRPLAQFVREAAAAIGCDESFVALPLLVGLAIAIGTTRRIRLKWDWLEFPIIWAVIVAASGQRKSPGFYAALRPLHDMQHKLIEEYRAAVAAYNQQSAAYRQALADHKQSGGAPPDEPQRPVLKRLIVNDTTIEALALILEENPRGLGVVRDELSAWLASFNQYKAGRGSDASQWLELHRGGLLVVDRKTAERRTIYVPRAAASIGGTIQPGVIKRGYGKEQFENGMVARTLFAMPPSRQREWTDRHVEAHTRDRVTDIYAKLAALDFDREGEPVDLPLTAAAQQQFIRFVNEHGAEQARLGDERLEAAWSKLEGYAARLALIVHLVRWAAKDSSLADGQIDEHSINCGIALARWFGHEARRVYADMGMSDEDRQRAALVEHVRGKGGAITPRELTRGCRRYSTTEAAELALEELVGLKIGTWYHPPSGPAGGRPQKHFVLCSTSADIDETPESDAPAGVSSAAGAESGGFVGADDDGFERAERDAVQWADRIEGVQHG